MKPGIPWSVKGIGNEAREAAKTAARRSGVTLGEWLNSVILEQAEGEGPPMNQLEPQASGFAMPKRRVSDAPIRLDDLAQQLNRLTQRDQDTAANKFHYQPAPAPLDKDMAARLLARIEMNERQTLEAFSAVNERLNSLSQEIGKSGARMPERPEDIPGYQALDGALRNIVGHIEISDKRTRDTLKSLQDRVTDIGQRVAASDPDRLLQNAPVIAQMDGRFNELAGRLERLEYSAQRDLPGIVEGQFAKLAERIETVRQNAETHFHHVESNATQLAQRELQEVENRLRALITDTQSTIRLNQASTSDIRRLHSDIEGLSQRIDDIKSDAASERDLYAMRQAIEQLSARIAQGPDLRPLAEMDRKLADLSIKLEQMHEGPDLSPQLYELEQRVAGLDQRLREALDRQSDPHVYQALEQQISEVTQRLSVTDSRLGHLVVLEQSINQLYESLEQSRNWTQKVAEDAANRMADRLLQAQQASQKSGPSPELMALENGLAAVRAAASAADRRNQETLEAVHETLEQIVNKLTELESSPPASWRAALEAAIPAPVTYQPAQEIEPQQTHVAHQPPPSFDQPPFAYQDRAQQSASIADLGPVTAGPVYPDPAAPLYPQASPVETSTSAPFPGLSMGPPEPQILPQLSADDLQRDDFIAAARRAAQVASQQIPESAPASAAKSPSLLNKAMEALSSLRGSGKSATKPVAQTFPTITPPVAAKVTYKTDPGHRKRLILAGLVLLASVAAYTSYQFGSTGNKAVAPTTAPAPAALEAVPEAAPPAATNDGAQPPKPRPAELENSSSLGRSNLDRMSNRLESNVVDNVLTATVSTEKADTTLREVLAEGNASDSTLPMAALPISIGPDSLRTAATSGDAIAQFVVASKFLDGRQVEQDLTQAAQWYRAAASKGLPPAQYRLATLFERGRGVPKDVATARVWYERAAEKGNVKAMHNVAVIYASTEAGPPDYDQAFKWFRSAADYGLKDSQFNLAVLYERGLGTTRNLGEAMFWYSLAGQQNDNDAANKATMLGQSLAPLTVSEVKSRLSTWQAKQGLPEANVVAVTDASWQGGNTASNASALPAQETSGQPGIIKQAQDLLTGLGFNVGTADGRMGNKTANAIRLFQLQEGLRVTGEVTPALIEQLQTKQTQGQQS